MMRELAFCPALQTAAANSSIAETVSYSSGFTRLSLGTNYANIPLAIAVGFLRVLPVIPVCRGWLELGRGTSMNPLEIANAFGAELIVVVDQNGEVSDVVKQLDGRRW